MPNAPVPPPFPDLPWTGPLLERLEARFRTEARDGAHDLSHACRVARTIRHLALAEGADVEVCVAAALLHDLVHLPKNHPDSPRTAALGAEEARAWCLATPGLGNRADRVAQAVATHSFSGGERARSLEGALLQDADRLEAIGAVGLARVFATGGAMGAGLWHPEDPWARARILDDKAWSLDHFAKKLLGLAAAMNSPAARRLAEPRQEVLCAFLEALEGELSS
jgi:uncharacterized protein